MTRATSTSAASRSSAAAASPGTTGCARSRSISVHRTSPGCGSASGGPSVATRARSPTTSSPTSTRTTTPTRSSSALPTPSSRTPLRRSEALLRALACALRLDLAVARRGVGHERREQVVRRVRDLVDRAREGLLVRLRRLREPADLPHVLLGRGAHFVLGRGRFEVVERMDVPAHGLILGRSGRALAEPPQLP